MGIYRVSAPAQEGGGEPLLEGGGVSDWSTLAGRVRGSRERCGYQQGELAERMGWTRTTISDWETGRTRRPGRDKIRALAEVLGVDAEWLATGSDIPPGMPHIPTDRPGASPEALVLQAVTLLTQALHLLQAPRGASAALAAVTAVDRSKPSSRKA